MSGDIFYSDEDFTVAVNPDLSEKRRVMVLEVSNGPVMALLTPTMPNRLGLYQQRDLSEPIFRRKLNEVGVTLHGADYFLFFSSG